MSSTTHVLVFPYPAYGHMPALLHLTHQLALHGLKLTILITPKNLHLLASLLSTHPNSIKTLILPFPPHPKLPLGVENVKDIGNCGNPHFIASLSKLESEVIQWFKSHNSPPQAIISDFFLGFTQLWAEKLNIPRISFFGTAAFLRSVFHHSWLNIAGDVRTSLDAVEFTSLPRSPRFVYEHLPSLFRKYRENDCDWEIVKEGMILNSKSWGYVFDSFYALEGEYLDHTKRELGHGRVYGVGPVALRRVNPESNPRSGSSSSVVINWLDQCCDGSVLYVCFGSQKVLTGAQMEALALGLDRSEAWFVWVVPHEFEGQVSGQGLVVKGWAPQVEILNHRAVGWFVSHCGWNSLQESIMAGVMILAWPMEADQFVNARLLVEHTGLAVRFCEGEHTVPDPDELAQTIREWVSGNVAQKERVKVMRERAFDAMKPGGSSSVDLIDFVNELSQIIAQEIPED